MDDNYEAKYKRLTEEPMNTMIPRLAYPAIISMLITSIYNMADTFYVSQIGQSESGAVGIVFSFMTIMQTIGLTIAVGCSINISNELGKRHKKRAETFLATGFFTMAMIGCLLAVVGMLFLDNILMFLGSTETILPYARIYASFILAAAPFMTSSYVMNNCLRAQGNALQSLMGLGTGSILNMILDPIFIFKWDMGIAGAGLSTAICQLVSFSILFSQCNFNSKTMSIKFSNFKPSFEMYKTILTRGFPNFCRQGFASLSSIVLNVIANPYGDAAIAAIGIVTRILNFITSALFGFGQGFQPATGFNYGAGRYDRVISAFWYTVKVGIFSMLCLGSVCFIFAEQIISIFRKGDLEVIEIAVFMLRAYCLVLPFQGISIVSTMLAQSIGYGYRATLLALSRQGIFFLPIIVIFSHNFGVLGIQISQPVAEVFAVILSISVLRTILRDLKNLESLHNTPKVSEN